MEKQYHQKEKYVKEQNQLETSTAPTYKSEFSLKDKENIFKDTYSKRELNSIEAWQRLCKFFQSQENIEFKE